MASCGNYQEVSEFDESFDSRILSLSNIDFATVKSEVFGPKCIQCHKQYDNYANVKSEINDIVDSISNNRMPKNGPPLNQSLKGLLIKWAETGAPEYSDGTSSTPLPPLEANWKSISQNIIIPRCIVCHNPNGQAKFLDLSSRQKIYNQRNRSFDGEKLIDLENPENSYMIQVILDPIEPMPPLESRIPQLKQEEINILKEWFKQGLP